jgi:hypothetical protein
VTTTYRSDKIAQIILSEGLVVGKNLNRASNKKKQYEMKFIQGSIAILVSVFKTTD